MLHTNALIIIVKNLQMNGFRIQIWRERKRERARASWKFKLIFPSNSHEDQTGNKLRTLNSIKEYAKRQSQFKDRKADRFATSDVVLRREHKHNFQV